MPTGGDKQYCHCDIVLGYTVFSATKDSHGKLNKARWHDVLSHYLSNDILKID